MPQTPQKKRIVELDMIKGIAIIFIMLRHISEFAGFTFAVSSCFYYLGECLMVLFFIASGYVYRQKEGTKNTIIKRAKGLLVPLFWALFIITGLYFVRWVLIERQSLEWFFQKSICNWLGLGYYDIIKQMPLPNDMGYGMTTFWFIYEFFAAFCLFVPLFSLVVNRGLIAKFVLFCSLLALCAFCVFYDPQGTIADNYKSPVPFILVIINIFGISALLVLGAILKELNAFNLSEQKSSFRLTLALFSFAIVALILSDYDASFYAFQYGAWGQYGVASVFITTLGGLALSYFLLFCAFYIRRIVLFEKLLIFFGKNTLDLFLWHVIVVESICYIGGFWYPVYSKPYDISNFSYFNYAITLLLTFGLCSFYIWFKNRKHQQFRQHLQKFCNHILYL